ncbi:hypothetical protein E2C01_008354 [Portunus trituberculatus]|uniref:Uncharacterized protein n=1 Tax=Portunus trituberculatus TaxID=210409 RepID=A0A5B7D251_PORTR|nr:hypothetical protein [Portunus trituberculatus]
MVDVLANGLPVPGVHAIRPEKLFVQRPSLRPCLELREGHRLRTLRPRQEDFHGQQPPGVSSRLSVRDGVPLQDLWKTED